ncbi:Signal transduction histidine-protein kinase ArlS [compost metagenome]
MEEISHRLSEKELEMDIRLKEDRLLKDVNQDLLFQLFYNLINNAIKYNVNQGSILITDEFPEGKNYVITIQDTGIGIAEEDLDFIFDRFRKANLTENVGYGLGLSIVKSITLYHGIEIRVKSKVNEGTTFSLIFPAL